MKASLPRSIHREGFGPLERPSNMLLRIFLSPRSECIFLFPGYARAGLCGARLRDNEAEKRHPVSGLIVERMTADPMGTKPSSTRTRSSTESRRGEVVLDKPLSALWSPASKKRTM